MAVRSGRPVRRGRVSSARIITDRSSLDILFAAMEDTGTLRG
jgi:hypothetical protein